MRGWGWVWGVHAGMAGRLGCMEMQLGPGNAHASHDPPPCSLTHSPPSGRSPHPPGPQILVTGASVVAVLFVVLMSLPRAGGPVALPALAVLWGVLSGLALLLHAELPVPQGMVNVRLFPDSKVQVRLAAGAVHAPGGLRYGTVCASKDSKVPARGALGSDLKARGSGRWEARYHDGWRVEGRV